LGGAAVFSSPKSRAGRESSTTPTGNLSIPLEAPRTGFPATEKEIAISLHSRRQSARAKVIYENPEMFDRVKRARAVRTTADSSYGCPPDSSFGYDRTGSAGMKPDNKREAFTIGCAIRLQRTQILPTKCGQACLKRVARLPRRGKGPPIFGTARTQISTCRRLRRYRLVIPLTRF
jgi:DNA adenine methylase